MTIIETSNTENVVVIINAVIKLFAFVCVSDFGGEKIAASFMVFFTDLAFVKGLLSFAMSIDMAKSITSEADILLRTAFGIMRWREAVETDCVFWAYGLIMPNFVALKADDVIFEVPKMIVVFVVGWCIL